MFESYREWQPVPNSRLFELGKSGYLRLAAGALGTDRARMDVNAAETMLEFGHKCCVISGGKGNAWGA